MSFLGYRFSETEIRENIPVLPDGKTSHILVLYSSKDTEVAMRIINSLENHFAISCNYYDRDCFPGRIMLQNIETGVSRCLSVLLLITQNFVESRQCMFETELAVTSQLTSQSEISAIPVLLESCKLPLVLSSIRCIDAHRHKMTIADITFDVAATLAAPYLKHPRERELDPLTQQIYEKAITEGSEEDGTIRLMIVGCHDQGKTTLARRLLNQPLEGIESTNGIDIHRVVCTKDVNTWEYRKELDIHKESIKRLALTRIEGEENKEKQSSSDHLFTAVINYTREPRTGVTRSDIQDDELPASLKGPPVRTQSNKYSNSELILFQEFRKELSSAGQKTTQEITLWDFGGQFIFYATHQLFHSRNAVYLLVFDLHKELNSPVIDDDYPGETNAFVKSMKDYIEFWVSSVHSFVGSKASRQPTIILIGTHIDELKGENAAEEYFESVRKLFDGRNLRYHIYRECFAVSGTTDLTDDVIDRLRETIIKVGRENKIMVPARWIPLEMALKERQKENIMTFENVVEANNSLPHPIEKEDEIKSFLKVHHARGTFIYFDDGEMAKFVIVNPPYIVDAFKCIITSGRFCRNENDLRPLWQKLCQHAILDPVLLQSVWENNAVYSFGKYKDVLISVLKRNRIISEALKFDEKSENLTPLGFFLVPSLLRKSINGEIETFLNGRNYTTVSFVYVFENESVVSTVFNRVTAAASGSWPVVEVDGNNLLFEEAGVYRLNISHAGLILRFRNMIELLVVHMCPGKAISPEKADYLRRFVEHVIGHEFRKLVSGETDLQPFKTAVRCQHKLHNGKGSKSIYDYETLKKVSEKDICCPDNLLHDSINIESIKHEWFMLETRHKVIPKRRLSVPEYSRLSMAIGSNWQQLGLQLGIDHVRIDHIETDCSTTSIRVLEMLLAWDSEQDKEATLDKLIDKVRILPPDTVNWDSVNNVIDNIC